MVYRIFWFTFRETKSKMGLNGVTYYSNIAFFTVGLKWPEFDLTRFESHILTRQYFYFDPKWPILKIVWTNFIGRLNEKKK